MKFLKNLATAALAASFTLAPAFAQTVGYPNKPVRVIVPFPAGQATDIIGRLVAQKLGDKWGQPLVIDNRVGAGGITGADIAAKSAPDGYTLLVAGSGPLSILPAINSSLPYAPMRDFQPLGLVASMPMLMVSAPTFEAKTAQELITLARAKPGDLSYASSGTGSTGQLAAELFISRTQTKIVHVPYKGSGMALTDVIAGRVPFTVESQAAILPLASRLRIIAVTGAKRSLKYPDVPTLEESGLPNFDVVAWIGLVGPTNMPPAIVKKISDDLVAIVATKEVQDRIADLGLEAAPLSAEKFGPFIKSEIDKFTSIAKTANIKAESN